MRKETVRKRTQEVAERAKPVLDRAIKRLPKADREFMEAQGIGWAVTFESLPKPSKKKQQREVTSRGGVEEFWCAVKHGLHQEEHLAESIANVAALGDSALLAEVGQCLTASRRLRRRIARLMQSGRVPLGENADGCGARCRDDL